MCLITCSRSPGALLPPPPPSWPPSRPSFPPSLPPHLVVGSEVLVLAQGGHRLLKFLLESRGGGVVCRRPQAPLDAVVRSG